MCPNEYKADRYLFLFCSHRKRRIRCNTKVSSIMKVSAPSLSHGRPLPYAGGGAAFRSKAEDGPPNIRRKTFFNIEPSQAHAAGINAASAPHTHVDSKRMWKTPPRCGGDGCKADRGGRGLLPIRATGCDTKDLFIKTLCALTYRKAHNNNYALRITH